MSLSTHILNTATGLPARGVQITLTQASEQPAEMPVLEQATTDEDGRYRFQTDPQPGTYTLRFDTGSYYAAEGTDGLYPWVDITFTVSEAGPSHLHIPLLLSPFGFSTYRGS